MLDTTEILEKSVTYYLNEAMQPSSLSRVHRRRPLSVSQRKKDTWTSNNVKSKITKGTNNYEKFLKAKFKDKKTQLSNSHACLCKAMIIWALFCISQIFFVSFNFDDYTINYKETYTKLINNLSEMGSNTMTSLDSTMNAVSQYASNVIDEITLISHCTHSNSTLTTRQQPQQQPSSKTALYKCVFNNLNGQGANGPTKVSNYYRIQAHYKHFKLDSTTHHQIWTVPYTGWYKMTAYGAQGGNSTMDMRIIGSDRNNITINGGKGAKVGGLFQLNKNDNIHIVVGQCGTSKPIINNKRIVIPATGGGGGTYVIKNEGSSSTDIYYKYKPLLIAAGGHGISQLILNHDEREYYRRLLKLKTGKISIINRVLKKLYIYNGMAIQFDNRNCLINQYISDGRAGHGGSFQSQKHTSWTSNDEYSQNYHGYDFIWTDSHNKHNRSSKGGTGKTTNGSGGFGGGGAAGIEGGAGGGYVGGIVQGISASFDKNSSLNGALSFNDATYGIIMESGVNYGNGKVEIEYLGKFVTL